MRAHTLFVVGLMLLKVYWSRLMCMCAVSYSASARLQAAYVNTDARAHTA